MKLLKIGIFVFVICFIVKINFVLAGSCGSLAIINDGVGDNSPSGDSNDSNGSTSMSNPSKSSTKPDLFIKEFYFGSNKRTHYYDDESVHLYAQVKNVGKSVSTGITKITLKYYRFRGEKINGDLKELGSDNIKGENLASGKTKSEDMTSSVPDDEDKYQYYACIDAGKVVAENNENNNCSNPIAIRVHKRPDLHVSNLITDDENTTSFIKGDPNGIYGIVTLRNDGGEPFDDVPVRWYLDGVHIGDDNMRHWNLQHNDVKHEDISFLVPDAIGAHALRACADFPDDKDQSDNCKEMTFKVLKPPIPGDLNSDGTVNLSDYNILLKNLNATDCGNIADINGDCVVDIFDYNILRENFGKTN